MSELKAFESERIYWSVEQVEREAGDTVMGVLIDYNWMFERAMNTQRALLRLRIGFAKLSSDMHHYKGILKRVKFWDRVRHNFIFRLDRFNKRLKR